MDRTNRPRGPRCAPLLLALAGGALALTLSGCSLVVMAGKMFFGDPLLTSQFEQYTKINLADDEKRVLVLCTSPPIAAADSGLEADVIDGLTQRMRRHDIRVVNANELYSWLNEHGGRWDDVSELADDLPADVIVHVELEDFSLYEENSGNLYRGTVKGNVIAYEVEDTPGGKTARNIFNSRLDFQHPRFSSQPVDQLQERTFRHRVITALVEDLGRLFYDHRAGENF